MKQTAKTVKPHRVISLLLALCLAAGGLSAGASAASIPPVPANFKAVSASYNAIKLTWSTVVGASGYVLYRYNPTAKAYARLAVIKTPGYTNTGLMTGAKYFYKVRAYQTVSGVNVYGNPSAAVSAVPVPGVPANFKAAKAGDSSIKLSWSTVSGASGYFIYRSDASGGYYVYIGNTGSYSYLDERLNYATGYYYKVKAYRNVNGSNVYGSSTVAKGLNLPYPAPSELIGVAPARLAFTIKMLNLYDKSSASSEVAFNRIKNFVTRDQIINYGKTGSGLSVINYDNGTPALALINCNSSVTNVFNTAINEMKNYDSNFLKVLTSNGMVAFMANKFPGGGYNFTYNKEGLINWSIDSGDEVNYNIKRPLETESFGIKMLNLGGDYANYAGYLKEQLSSDCWWNLYKKMDSTFVKQCLIVVI